MGGMASCRGLEWRQRTGDGSHDRYIKNMEKLFPVPYNCLTCEHLSRQDTCLHITREEHTHVGNVTKKPGWCPSLKKED